MESYGPGTSQKRRWLAYPTLVLVLGAGCSATLDSRKRSGADDESDLEVQSMRGGLRFPNQDLAAKHKAAKAAPESFDAVAAYAQAVMDFCLASLLDKSCASCEGGLPKYKRRSELNPHVWPVLEDALPRLDTLMSVKGLQPAQMEQLVAVKGRLLWMVGRSTEEQTLIDNYALAHPDAVAVVRRRFELLREAGDLTGLAGQCTRSRASIKSAPDAARLDLMMSCVALHPDNADGRTDTLDYAQYLPGISNDEDRIYRAHLAQLCVQRVGENDASCAEGCVCGDQGSEKPTVKCKRACRDCRSLTVQKLRVCKQIGEVAAAPVARTRRAPARAARSEAAPLSAPAPRPKSAPARRPKDVDPASAPQQAEL